MASRDKHFNVEAYLKQMVPKDTINFYGIEIETPTDTPLSYTLRAKEIQEADAQDTSNVLRLLADILGQDVADQIEERDPGIRAIGALLLWAFKNASGEEIDFPTAFEEYLEQEKENREKALAESGLDGESEDDEEGKAEKVTTLPNRSERRAADRASGRKSAATSR